MRKVVELIKGLKNNNEFQKLAILEITKTATTFENRKSN